MGDWRCRCTLALRLWLVVRWAACAEFVVVVVENGIGVEARVRGESIVSISDFLVVCSLEAQHTNLGTCDFAFEVS